MDTLDQEILKAMNRPNHPMHTVYGVCHLMGKPQQSSQNKFYARVYRHMEKLVDMKLLQVVRGTRDPSVYISMEVVK